MRWTLQQKGTHVSLQQNTAAAVRFPSLDGRNKADLHYSSWQGGGWLLQFSSYLSFLGGEQEHL